MPDTLTLDTIRPLLPQRPADAHKGTFGHVLILAGSERYLGAARLCGGAAARSGVGLVTLGVPGAIAPAIAGQSLETMTVGLGTRETAVFDEDNVDDAVELAESMTAVGLGPGLTHGESPEAFVHGFVPQCPAPLVIDADGLNCLSAETATLTKRTGTTILTPHPGEMARLTGNSTREIQRDRNAVARQFAMEFGCVLVLKGSATVVANAIGEVAINSTGNSGLATGGTGDVLTGLVAGLLAQRLDAFDAARIAVFVHGLAADIAANELTERGLIARDVIDYLPRAWRAIESGATP